MAGAGLDATIVTKVNPALKARAGKLAYWVAGLGEFFSTVGQFQAKIDGRQTQHGFVLVSRVRNYGGDMEIASERLAAQRRLRSGPVRRIESPALRRLHDRRNAAASEVHARRASRPRPNASNSPAPPTCKSTANTPDACQRRLEMVPDALTLLDPVRPTADHGQPDPFPSRTNVSQSRSGENHAPRHRHDGASRQRPRRRRLRMVHRHHALHRIPSHLHHTA